MRVAIHSPYLDSLGGGERYVISFAKVLLDMGWDVYVEGKGEKVLEKIKERLAIDTSGMRVVEDIKRGDGYDLCFWLSDGSVPTLFSRNNILHFQRPFYKVDGKSLINRMKFFRINSVVVNSKFTKTWIDKEYPKDSIVIYPPVDIKSFKPGRKENMILYVGRFSRLEQSKGQDVLVEVFKKMYDKKESLLKSGKWRLVLAGGSDIGRDKFVDKLKQDSKTYPISIVENIPFKELKRLYAKAKIFWSAAGFGVDEDKNPEKTEHFGITVIEAMSAGCAPVIMNAGGHKEIIKDGKNGYLWKNKKRLIASTNALISKSRLLIKLGKQAQQSANKYSYECFEEKVKELL